MITLRELCAGVLWMLGMVALLLIACSIAGYMLSSRLSREEEEQRDAAD